MNDTTIHNITRAHYAIQTRPDRRGRVITVSHGYAGSDGESHALRDLPLLEIAHRRPLQLHCWTAAA